MKFGVSTKTSNFEKKLHIPKGYYKGQLISVKDRAKQDGTLIEGKFGPQAVMMFRIYDKEGEVMKVTETNDQGGGITREVEIPLVINTAYKNNDGSLRTAFTPKSRATKVFKALGWNLVENVELDTDKFIGKFCELNIDDYDAEETVQDGQGNDKTQTYKASGIKDVASWEGDRPSPEKASSDTSQYLNEKAKEIKKKMADMDSMKEKGMLTEEGYKKAMKELNEQLKAATFEYKG